MSASGSRDFNPFAGTSVDDLSSHPVVRALSDDIDDSDLVLGVAELFERTRQLAREGRIDLVILSARRLACLYQLAVESGMAPISECLVVSDRFLDVAPGVEGWEWPNVLVLDDSVVLGTTLHYLVSLLEDRVGPGGTVQAAAVVLDEDQVAGYLIDSIAFAPLRRRSRQGVEEFSLNVVQALFRHQIPFISDFPVSSVQVLDASEWQTYLAAGPWAVADVTAPLIGDETRSALVMVPNDAMVDSVLTRLPPSVGRLIESFKLRAWIAPGEATDAWHVRLVPIAMLGACQSEDLDSAIADIVEIVGADRLPRVSPEVLRPEAKHRLVQMFASAAVLCVYLRDAYKASANASPSGLRDVLARDPIDALHASLYFGPYSAKLGDHFGVLARWMDERAPGSELRPFNEALAQPEPSTLLSDIAMRTMLWEQRELLASTPLPERPQPGHLTKIGLIFGSSLSSVFGFVSRTYELRQRAAIKALPSIEAFQASEFVGSQRVLNQGFTLQELTAALCPELSSGPAWTRSLMSLGVDIGNDLGIIVPATQVDPTGLVYRCYRLGETAYLADQPLPGAARSISEPDIPNTSGLRSRVAWLLRQTEVTANSETFVGHWDRVSQAVLDGYPVESSLEDIRTSWWPRMAQAAAERTQAAPSAMKYQLPHDRSEWSADLERLKELMDLVLTAVPGPFAERFEGVVTRRSEHEFQAQMIQSRDGATAAATIPTDMVEAKEQEWLREGAEFVWAQYEARPGEDATSRLRFIKHPPLDEDVMARAATAHGARTAESESAE